MPRAMWRCRYERSICNSSRAIYVFVIGNGKVCSDQDRGSPGPAYDLPLLCVPAQVFGDGLGGCWAIGERDCSAQRRHQKVLEETPAPNLPPATRTAMLAAAERLCASVSFRGAGTVEFLYDPAADVPGARAPAFTFLEVNARLQVP
jgi:hypothetical protein